MTEGRPDGVGVSHDDIELITDTVHGNSWSANLEQPRHADDRALLVEQTIDAIEHTVAGNHVNLVTHGHPSDCPYTELDALADSSYEYLKQCSCGGHVVRVHVE